jgi:hypothetical protein
MSTSALASARRRRATNENPVPPNSSVNNATINRPVQQVQQGLLKLKIDVQQDRDKVLKQLIRENESWIKEIENNVPYWLSSFKTLDLENFDQIKKVHKYFCRNFTFIEYYLGTFTTNNTSALLIDSAEYPDGLYSFVIVNLDTETNFASDFFIDNAAPSIEYDADPFGFDVFDPYNGSHYLYLDVVDNSGYFEPNFIGVGLNVDWGYHQSEETLFEIGNITYIGFNNYDLPEYPYTGIRFSFLPDFSFFDYAGNEIDYGPYYVPEETQPYIFAAIGPAVMVE